MGYADLAAVKKLLNIEDASPDLERDALLDEVNSEVTAVIEAQLGRVWPGTPAAAEARPATVYALPVLFLPSPAVTVLRVTVDDTTTETIDLDSAIVDRVTGYVTAVARRDGTRWASSERLATVEAFWADSPGGDPPAPIVSFANWAVAQVWRRRQAGSGGMLGPEGYTVTVDDPWRSNDWQQIRQAYRVRLLPVV